MNKAPKKKLRAGESPGSGIIIIGRHKKTGELASNPGARPYEHESFMAAANECVRLSAKEPHLEFEIYTKVDKRG